MKIFLDLEKKTVQIIDLIGFDELEELKRFLGDDYKEWKIEPTADAPEKEYVPVPANQPITFPQPNFPGTFPNQPFQPYNPFPIITYGPGPNTIIGTGTGTAVVGTGTTIGGTTGTTDVSSSSYAGNCGTYTTAGNLSVFSHADDENKIMVAGDFSSANLNKILQDKGRES